MAAVFSSGSLSKAQTEGVPASVDIAVQVLDGRNGRPIPNQRVLVFVGKSNEAAKRHVEHTDLTTDKDGLGTLRVHENQSLADGQARPSTSELKALTAAGANTLKNAIQDAAKQGQNILVDARNVNIDAATASQQIQRAQGNVGGLQGRVTVLTKDGTVKF